MSYNTPNRNYPVPNKGKKPYYDEIKTTFDTIAIRDNTGTAEYYVSSGITNLKMWITFAD